VFLRVFSNRPADIAVRSVSAAATGERLDVAIRSSNSDRVADRGGLNV
jgi:hypothetical protein